MNDEIKITELTIERVARCFKTPFIYVRIKDTAASTSASIDAHLVTPEGDRRRRRKSFMIPFIENEGWRRGKIQVEDQSFTINGSQIFVAICFEMWSPSFLTEIKESSVDAVVVLSSLDVFNSKRTSLTYRQVIFQTWIRSQILAKATVRPVLVVLKSGETIYVPPLSFKGHSESIYEKMNYSFVRVALRH